MIVFDNTDGERSRTARTNRREVRLIRACAAAGVKLHAMRHGWPEISPSQLHKIMRGKAWQELIRPEERE